MKSFEIFWIILEFFYCFGYLRNLLESFEVIWNFSGSLGIFWVVLESFGFFGCLCKLSLQALSTIESFEYFGILQSSFFVLGLQLLRITQQLFGFLGCLWSPEYLEPCFVLGSKIKNLSFAMDLQNPVSGVQCFTIKFQKDQKSKNLEKTVIFEQL